MRIARVGGLLGLVTTTLAATVQVDLQPCILAPSTIVSAACRRVRSPVSYFPRRLFGVGLIFSTQEIEREPAT